MKNYISINDQHIELTDEQVEKIRASLGIPGITLSDVPVGDTIKIGKYEMIVLEHYVGMTAVILKDLLISGRTFGENNKYDGSNVDHDCIQFASEIADIVGKENLVEHTVDLTSDDGLKDYGTIKRRTSILTADRYRRYVETLDKHKINAWWWLATPHSTARHENASWVKCVSPSGRINYFSYFNCYFGFRPFCILKSDIFVSK